jgi:hypothetical protein
MVWGGGKGAEKCMVWGGGKGERQAHINSKIYNLQGSARLGGGGRIRGGCCA